MDGVIVSVSMCVCVYAGPVINADLVNWFTVFGRVRLVDCKMARDFSRSGACRTMAGDRGREREFMHIRHINVFQTMAGCQKGTAIIAGHI